MCLPGARIRSQKRQHESGYRLRPVAEGMSFGFRTLHVVGFTISRVYEYARYGRRMNMGNRPPQVVDSVVVSVADVYSVFFF